MPNREIIQVDIPRIGDYALINPTWNTALDSYKVTPPRHYTVYRLPDEVEILGVRSGQMSQTGILYKVRTEGGIELWLDSAWFTLLPDGWQSTEK